MRNTDKLLFVGFGEPEQSVKNRCRVFKVFLHGLSFDLKKELGPIHLSRSAPSSLQADELTSGSLGERIHMKKKKKLPGLKSAPRIICSHWLDPLFRATRLP